MKKTISRKGMRIRGTPAKSVDDYLAPLPKDVKSALENLRNAIKIAAPKALETISYGMPAYKYQGQLVFFAAFEKHCSFFPGSRTINRKFHKELKAYEISGTAIHFTASKPLPAALVRKIVKARIEENELRAKKRRK